jgi:hypothetical protein
VHVPAKEERGVGAEGCGRYEVGPCWAEEELDECGLEGRRVSSGSGFEHLANLQSAPRESR